MISVWLQPIRSLPPGLVCCGVLCLGLFSGCIAEQSSHVVSGPPPPAPLGRRSIPPTPAELAAPPAAVAAIMDPAQSTIIVTQLPRSPLAETVTAPPSYRHAWLSGYWTWRDDGYEWVAGHWEEPPGNSVLWVRPRWERVGDDYLFHEGYWN